MWKNKVQFFHTSLQNAWGRFAPFPQASPPSIHEQQNRTFHLLQKPDISICYRHHDERLCRLSRSPGERQPLDRLPHQVIRSCVGANRGAVIGASIRVFSVSGRSGCIAKDKAAPNSIKAIEPVNGQVQWPVLSTM